MVRQSWKKSENFIINGGKIITVKNKVIEEMKQFLLIVLKI